ncbi:FG-GAP repeat protein [Posidoniimonas corsicana]|uniref:FG-GAP repeat protein n=1 Tax=Posidoniimonas corsicana TaxID=1938618 RepID=A0A5C5VEL2_9BACT|nr:VCBS repeat-containing protein [Posidoniimonas corsicana]TWT36591.1 FG-GAP repeat protein [Posidoniimonas corsicana]
MSSPSTNTRSPVLVALVGLLLVGSIVAAVLVTRSRDAGLREAAPAAEQGSGAPAVATPEIPFTDVAKASGVDFVHHGGATGEKMLPESGGSGCGWIDYDNDGDTDLLLISGRSWPWDAADEDATSGGALRLYQNDGGKFADVTQAANLAADYYGQGVAIGDFDADGDDDLYITAVGPDHLYRNDGGVFTEVGGAASGLGGSDAWTTSAGFFDYDNDGDLDLFVCNYVAWDRARDKAAVLRVPGTGSSYAHPSNFDGTNNFLFRNDAGRFTDVSAEAGVHVFNAEGAPLGKALAVTFVDYNADGWIDVFVANDTVRHFLFQNNQGVFEEVGEARGFALNAAGATTSGMGIDAAWLYNDDRLAVAVSNFAGEMTELFTTPAERSDHFFVDETVNAGVGGPTLDSLTFGLQFDDFDLDGRVDMVHANGHLEETIQSVQPEQSYRQSAQLLWNTGATEGPVLTPVPVEKLKDLAKPIVGRATASADFDNDGDVDLVITQAGGPPLLLRNDQQLGGNWLHIRLRGPEGNPHGIGARIELLSGGDAQQRTLMPTRSYLAQSAPMAVFGLGEHDEVDSLRITWADGREQFVQVSGVNQVVTVARESATFEELANTAVAQLENSEFEAAIDTLERAVQLNPESGPTLRNLARAYLLGGQPAAAERQLTGLPKSEARPPAGISYLRGLAANRLSEPERAVEQFREAVRLDPREPTLHFQFALALAALGDTDAAQAELLKTAELDPLHGGAQYQLAAFARKSGDRDAFRRYMRDYQRIRKLKDATDTLALEVCRYTMPEVMLIEVGAPDTAVPVEFQWEAISADGVPALLATAVLSMNDDGRYQLVGITTASVPVVFEWDAENGYQERARGAALFEQALPSAVVAVGNAIADSPVRSGMGAEVGDFSEIAVVTPMGTRLIRHTPDVGFEDLTQAARLGQATGAIAKWADLDHDGDIDLCIGGPGGVAAWRNNGDGSFVDATSEFGLADTGPWVDFAAVDLDGVNLGVDLVQTGGVRPRVLRNAFGGAFKSDPEAAWPPAERVLLDDLNNDGVPEIVCFAANVLTVVDAAGEILEEIATKLTDIEAATVIDADNDGRLDIAAAGAIQGAPAIVVWRNTEKGFAGQASHATLPAPCRPSGLIAMDITADGKSDIVAVGRDDGVSILANATITKNQQLKLAIRSYAGHPSSIGVRVQVRRERFVASRWLQEELPIELGVNSLSEVDAIQTLWPNGVARNEIGKQFTGDPIRITIIEFVRTSSCPFLYAMVDGAWTFVTDLLGTAPLNVSVARGVPMPPDPDELYVLGPAARFTDQNGRVRLRVTSELREAVYLDSACLLAVDHPVGCEVVSRDRATTVPISGERFALARGLMPVRSALDSTGADCTAQLSEVDGVYTSPGELLPYPAVGYTRPHSIEFEFGELPAGQELLLVLTGWFRFGDSSTNIAASQRTDLAQVWPVLEAAGDDGKFYVVDDAIGFPAGNTKSIVCDLSGKLSPNAVRFRLTSSFEVRWDQIAMAESAPSDAARVSRLPATSADLQWHGFAALPQRSLDQPQVPDLSRIRDRPQWLTCLEGWCTRYGEVAPLLATADERIAILNSGDGVILEFNASRLPEVEPGTQRTLLLYHHGWIKEENPNSLPDRNVAPFPGSEDAAEDPEDDWQLLYNTRWVSRSRFAEGPLEEGE